MTDAEYPMTPSQTSVADVQDQPDRRAAAPILTMERAAYVAIGLLAAALRFFQLGLQPLTEGEAVQALAAYRFSQGTSLVAPAGTLPALFTGNVVGFTLMGTNDYTARWLPALAGLTLALLPYGLRQRLGRGGALAASLLLAISPSAVYFSRTLDAAIVVAACGLALVVGLISYVDTRRPGYLYLAAGALGLGLSAGPGIYSLLVIIALFVLGLYLVERIWSRQSGWSAVLGAWQETRGEKSLLLKSGGVLAAAFGLVAMTFALHPAGVGHAADLIGAWFASFLPEAEGQPALYPVLLLLRYELLILVLGLVELLRWVIKGGADASDETPDEAAGSTFPHTAFLAVWALLALLIVVAAGHRPGGNILLVTVPLALLGGQGVERTCRWISRRQRWRDVALIATVAVGLGIFVYLQLAFYSSASQSNTVSVAGVTLHASVTYLILVAVGLVLVVALGAAAWYWRGRSLVLAGGWLAMVIMLGLIDIKLMAHLSFSPEADARDLMIPQATAPDVRMLVQELEKLSMDRVGDAHTLAFAVDGATGPVVAWYLRPFEHQRVVGTLTAPPEEQVAVTLAQQDLPIGETYRGQGFPLRAHWGPWGLRGESLMRWLLFNEGSQPVVDQEVVVWVQGGATAGDDGGGSNDGE
jgi:uncharacterized protein (TIGR03663 family)